MKIKTIHEKVARITFEQHGELTDDKRAISLYDFDTSDEVKQFIESIYKDYMKKINGSQKCKLKIQILDRPTDKKSGKQKKLEWSYWIYNCDVNAINLLIKNL